MEEEFLFFKPLQITTTGEDIFVMVDLFFKQEGLLKQKLSAFKGKLKLWMNKIEDGKTASFPSLSVLLENETFLLIEVKDIIEEHISKLITEFDRYISKNAQKYGWIRNSFNIEAEDLLMKLQISAANFRSSLLTSRMTKYFVTASNKKRNHWALFVLKFIKKNPFLEKP